MRLLNFSAGRRGRRHNAYPQVFAAEEKLGTPKEKIAKKLVPRGHIGLFMGSKNLKNVWPEVASWIKRELRRSLTAATPASVYGGDW